MKPSPRSPRTFAISIAVSFFMMSVTMGVPSKSACTLLRPSRCADHPQAPRSIASCNSRRISACSFSVGIRPDLASSSPMTQVMSGARGMKGSRLIPLGWRSTLSRNSG